MAASRNRDDRGPSHTGRQGLQVEGGGHQQHQQVGAQLLTGMAQQRQGQVGFGPALMEFIEDHGTDPHQFGIPLQAPEKQTSCHHFQPGGFGGAMVEAHAVAHLAARAFVEGLRQALSR